MEFLDWPYFMKNKLPNQVGNGVQQRSMYRPLPPKMAPLAQLGIQSQSAHKLASLTKMPASGSLAGISPSSQDIQFLLPMSYFSVESDCTHVYHLSSFLFFIGEKSPRQRNDWNQTSCPKKVSQDLEISKEVSGF